MSGPHEQPQSESPAPYQQPQPESPAPYQQPQPESQASYQQPQYQQQSYPSAQPIAQPYPQPYPQSFPQPYSQTPPMPPSNAGWAVVAVIFFWPLAISAFNHALKVHPLWLAGNFQGAAYSSNRASFFGKLSLGIFLGFFILYIAFIAIVIANS